MKILRIILRGILAVLFLVTAIWTMYYVFWFSLALILKFMSHMWLGILVIVMICGMDVLFGIFLFMIWAWIVPIDTKEVIIFFLKINL